MCSGAFHPHEYILDLVYFLVKLEGSVQINHLSWLFNLIYVKQQYYFDWPFMHFAQID